MSNIDLIENKLIALSKSKFRNSFKLKEKDFVYISSKGLNTIKNHATDFIKARLAPKNIPNDGKQTPMRGHPVFIAQHATATCCRECLFKWHKIEKAKQLSQQEMDFIIALIIAWIKSQLSK